MMTKETERITMTRSITDAMPENMIPDYEVKALLDSSVILGNNHEVSDEFIAKLKIISSEKIIVQYLETEPKDFNDAGWTCRIRIKEGKKKFDVTYKKRYRIENGNVASALELANEEGFDIGATSYEAQIDWGYNQMTLSLSNKKSYKNTGYAGLQLPDQQASIEILTEKIPGKLSQWNHSGWGEETLADSRIYGPILFTRYRGAFEGKTIDIEVWPIRTENEANKMEYITELSFKEGDFSLAQGFRSRLYAFLEEEGALLLRDSLKTQLILGRY